MVKLLGEEQTADNDKKAYCEQLIDKTEDDLKTLELAVSDLGKAIADLKERIATLTEEISALEDGIKALDKQVAEATEDRKEEHADNVETLANDNAAKELIGVAKNRMNKFYNPKLYVPPPKRELSEEERITVNMGGTLAPTTLGGIAGTGIGAALVEIRSHAHTRADHTEAPPPPPETFGPYTKKSEQGNGVIAMLDLLVKDLDKEMQEADVSEKDAQADYEKTMEDASAKRAADAKSMTEKAAEKATTEEELQAEKEKKADTTKELMATAEYISSLHGECDWLLQYHAARKDARTGEIESLVNAKAVLNGADYSLLQTRAASGFLAKRVQ